MRAVPGGAQEKDLREQAGCLASGLLTLHALADLLACRRVGAAWLLSSRRPRSISENPYSSVRKRRAR